MAKRGGRATTESKKNTEHWAEYFDRTFSGESDRACVILAAAMLEQALEVLLRATLVPIASQTDPLFDGAYAPVSTFSAKIDLAFRIGLIPASFTRDLHLVRKIRNDFAHNVTGCSFEDAVVRGRIVEITRSQKVVDWAPDIRESRPPGPRGDFQTTISWMLWWLWADTEEIESMEAHPEPPREEPKAEEEPAREEGVPSPLLSLGEPPKV